MKFSINKLILLLSVLTMTFLSSCKIDEIPNPNGASLEDILDGASASELQTLVTGIEALMGNDIGFYYDVTAIIGREYWYFTGSDPRYTGELLGREESALDAAGFYGTRPYFGRYRTVKNANILLEAVANAAPGLTEEDVAGYNGFARTIQAYEMLIVLNLQYQNGIRIDVADPDNLGSFVTYEAALSAISGLLDAGNADLAKAGAEFNYFLSEAWAGFDTPESFAKFNRAIAARVAIYQGDSAKAKTALSNSFMDMTGGLNNGPAIYFSLAGGETPNPLFRVTNQADGIIANPSFVAAIQALDGTADADDERQFKIQMREDTLTLDGLSGIYDVVVYTSFSDNVPLIRNEELLLISAEANIGTDNTAAIAAIDAIRTLNGSGPYAGGDSNDEVTDELLYQRWLSLYGEGHRWVDMRRFGRLGDLPIARAGDDVWTQMPRPISENE